MARVVGVGLEWVGLGIGGCGGGHRDCPKPGRPARYENTRIKGRVVVLKIVKFHPAERRGVRQLVLPAHIDAAAGDSRDVAVPLPLHAAGRLGCAGDVVVEPQCDRLLSKVGEGFDDLEGAALGLSDLPLQLVDCADGGGQHAAPGT